MICFLLVWLVLGTLAWLINHANEVFQDKWKHRNTIYFRVSKLDKITISFLCAPLALCAALVDSYDTFIVLRKEYNERKTTK